MLKLRWLLAVLLGVFLSTAALAAPPAGFWQNPAIKDAGAMHPLPQAGTPMPRWTEKPQVKQQVTNEA
ncbi:MAG: hypothetical protein KGJ04_01055 [Gammaproteobacteria bacterium]|nr:hypothetical protein [Gammaproteobacteria bacterium]